MYRVYTMFRVFTLYIVSYLLYIGFIGYLPYIGNIGFLPYIGYTSFAWYIWYLLCITMIHTLYYLPWFILYTWFIKYKSLQKWLHKWFKTEDNTDSLNKKISLVVLWQVFSDSRIISVGIKSAHLTRQLRLFSVWCWFRMIREVSSIVGIWIR